MTQTKVDYSNLTQNDTWVITHDNGVCNDCERATQEQVDQIIADGFTASFKLFDDDGELYYTGYGKPLTEVEGFEPLDDFGMPNAGCTDIRYDNGDFYESL